MTEQEAVEKLKDILAEATSSDNAVCYVTDCDKEPLDMAIKALEKQVAKRFIWKKDVHGVGRMSCPNCKEHYIRNPYKNSRHKHNEEIFPYCPWCGQKLDWSDEDDNH